MTVALAVVGVLVGAALGREVRRAWRPLVGASAQGFVTFVAVAAGAWWLAATLGLPLGVPHVWMALALGLCASASSATSVDPDVDPVAAVASRVADLDDVLPIVIATILISLLPGGSPRDVWMQALAPIGIGLAVGAVGWLLFERAESASERVVFVLGALALAGGAAAYLRVSPLGVGLIAGLCWTLAPGRADRIVRRDLLRVQHPLVVLLLVTAGARWAPSLAALWLVAPFVVCRLGGKLAGAWAAATVLEVPAGALAAYLMSPGILGVALALNFQHVLPAFAGDTLLAATAAGTALLELLGLAVAPISRRESP